MRKGRSGEKKSCERCYSQGTPEPWTNHVSCCYAQKDNNIRWPHYTRTEPNFKTLVFFILTYFIKDFEDILYIGHKFIPLGVPVVFLSLYTIY